MRHRDTPMGGFFLAEKEGGFTDRDEALLALIAQQAAAAIANARAHRDERHARANLEAKRIVAGPHTPGPPHRTVGGGSDLPARRRARGHARRSTQRRAGAGRGGRALGARRAECPDAARRGRG